MEDKWTGHGMRIKSERKEHLPEQRSTKKKGLEHKICNPSNSYNEILLNGYPSVSYLTVTSLKS